MNFLDGISKLSFETKEFHSENFSVDEFIQRKRHSVPLDVLRDDLGSHLKFLRSSLIELINQDYGQFVNLSSNLVGLDGRIQNIVGPLQRGQNDLQSMYESLNTTLTSLKQEMDKGRAIRDAKSQLQYLRMANTALESSEKYLKKVPSEIQTNVDFNLLKVACDEIAETKFLIGKLNESHLKGQMFTRWEVLRDTILGKLNDLLQLYANSDVTIQSSAITDLKSESESEKMVKSLLYMYSELECENIAEEIFVTKILKPKCETILSRKGNINALLDEMESFVNHSPIIKVSRRIEEFPWMTKYDFIARGVFSHVMNIFAKHFPHIWSAASPESFHANWKRCEGFIDVIELGMPSLDHLEVFRASETYKSFISKWQFLVYFQLRFHSLAIEFESALESLSSPCSTSDFKLDATRVLIKVLNQCWDKDKIFITQISGRFLKASALFISRYIHEVKTEVAFKKEAHLNLLINTYCDLNIAELVVRQILTQKMTELSNIFSTFTNGAYDSTSLPSPALQFFSDFPWDETRNAIENRLVDVTVGQSATSITSVTEVPRLFRRTNRDVPTKHGDYVDGILVPIVSLRNDMKSSFQGELWEKVGAKIGLQVTTRYMVQVQEVLTSVQRMEESLKRLKKVKGGQNQNISSNSSGGDSKMLSDDDKIRLQIKIDVEHFAKEMSEVCSNVDTNNIKSLFAKMNVKL